MAWIGRCGAPPGEEVRMQKEAREGYMDGNMEQLQDGIAKQVDSRCCKHCGFSYNTDFGQVSKGGVSDGQEA